MNSRRLLVGCALLAGIGGTGWAAEEFPVAIHEYKIGNDTYEGFVARPATESEKPRAAVLVVHDWMGNGPFSRDQAVRLAKLGYIGFAIDMYGKGVRASNSADASKLAGRFYQNPPMFAERMLGALNELKNMPGVDTTKIGAIGFCFGGTSVLELARSGADIAGVVSFHGGLRPFSTQPPARILPRILILHGTRDPHVRPDDVAACMSELNATGAAYRLVGYPMAVHAFTNPAAGDDPATGAAYQEAAATAAFEEMERFLLFICK